MAKFDLSKIAEPVSADQPCGPDLDMEFDDDFMAFMAELDGQMPTSYFKFQPGSLDFKSFYDRINDFLPRTRDFRLLVPLAKLKLLQGDLVGFAEAMTAIHALAAAHWHDVHPQPLDGDYEMRNATLYTLDDMPVVILPLQYATLVRSRRLGVITWRRWLIANKVVPPREGEEVSDPTALKQAIGDAESEGLRASLAALNAAKTAVAALTKVSIEEAGFDRSVRLEKLPQLIGEILTFMNANSGIAEEVAPEGEAEVVEAESTAEPGAQSFQTIVLPPGSVTTRDEVKQALSVSIRYFALYEPSSPVPILLREALAAVDKGFIALVGDFMPGAVEKAIVKLGRDPFFPLSLPDLDKRNPMPDLTADEALAVAHEDSGLDDGAEEVSEPIPEPAPVTTVTDAAPAPMQSAPVAAEPVGPKFWAKSRPEAMALIGKVVAYYKVAEPSSPVPLMLERAIEMSSKSFMDLLADVLPAGSLTKG